MKFNLSTSGSYYNDEDKNELEKLGFKFDEPSRPSAAWHKQSNHKVYIDFSSLDELVKFIKEYRRVVIEPPEMDERDWNIEIYDYYRE